MAFNYIEESIMAGAFPEEGFTDQEWKSVRWWWNWNETLFSAFRSLRAEIDCMKSNTHHKVKWKRIVAHCRWVRIVAQRRKVRWTRIEAQRRGQIPTITKRFFIWWTCARLGILRDQP